VSERERMIDRLLRAAGLKPVLVGIGRDDDLPWAKFQVGRDLCTLVASSDESDDSAVADIVIQAQELGVA
jgi:hypothetical protein